MEAKGYSPNVYETHKTSQNQTNHSKVKFVQTNLVLDAEKSYCQKGQFVKVI